MLSKKADGYDYLGTEFVRTSLTFSFHLSVISMDGSTG